MPLFHFCEDSDKRAKLHQTHCYFLHTEGVIETGKGKYIYFYLSVLNPSHLKPHVYWNLLKPTTDSFAHVGFFHV